MKQNISLFLLLFILFYSCQNPSQTDIAEDIKSFLESTERDSSLINAYAENNFRPIWTKSGGLKKNGRDFLEALDEIQFDGLDLEKNDMQVLDYQEQEIDHKDIDWKSLEDLKDFPYLIRQRPGAQNPLGKVKFMFPNDYISIFMIPLPNPCFHGMKGHLVQGVSGWKIRIRLGPFY